MLKKDFKKELKEFYNPSSKEISTVNVPAFDFVMIDGKGDPNNNTSFQNAIEALYAFSYTLKFKIKKGQTAVDYGVMPLEGLWWDAERPNITQSVVGFDRGNFDPVTGDRSKWCWTLMIQQPYITDEVFKETLEEVKERKALPSLDQLRLERFTEGKSVQIMHIGPFSEEGPNIAKLHNYIKSQNAKPNGKHHEIYLSDFRKTNPAKLKTVLRQPFISQ